jgi:hypothetical protein
MKALSWTLLSTQMIFSNAWSGLTFSRRDWFFISTLITQDTKIVDNSQDSSSSSNEDPLASFGRDLTSMKFNSSKDYRGGLFNGDQSNVPQLPVDKATNDLTNAIEQNKKKRSIDPRTHG